MPYKNKAAIKPLPYNFKKVKKEVATYKVKNKRGWYIPVSKYPFFCIEYYTKTNHYLFYTSFLFL
jgi:hypothetical protein